MKRLLITALLLSAAALSLAAGGVKRYKAKVVKEYPHSESAYTQGLFFMDGQMYESTGQYGESSFRKLDFTTGKALKTTNFKKTYFNEGSCCLGGNIYILTWQEKVVFVYDAATLTYKKTIKYNREGWGLTTDGKQLIASDGSSNLYFLDANLKTTKTLTVKINGRPLRFLNELEYIDGKVWANVYLSDLIVIINPASGVVEATVDCTGLLPKSLRTQETDVLNGIAFNPADKKIYVTGKYWPRLYEIEVQ